MGPHCRLVGYTWVATHWPAYQPRERPMGDLWIRPAGGPWVAQGVVVLVHRSRVGPVRLRLTDHGSTPVESTILYK